MSIEHRTLTPEQQQFTANVVEVAQSMSAQIVASIVERCGEPPTWQGREVLSYWSTDVGFCSLDSLYASRLLEGSIAGSDAFRIGSISTFFESWADDAAQRQTHDGRYLSMQLQFGDPTQGETIRYAAALVHALSTAPPFLLGSKAIEHIHALQRAGKLHADKGELSAEFIHIIQADEKLSVPGIYYLSDQESQVILSGLAQLHDDVNVLESLESMHGVNADDEFPDEAAWFKAAIDRFKAKA